MANTNRSDRFCFTLYTPDGDEVEVSLPGRFDVCPTCRGKGSHVNRNIDGNGITAEEMHELGDDFRDDYMRGVYDVPCEECGGQRVVLVAHEAHLSPEQAKQLAAYREQEAQAASDRASERRMIMMESGERW